MMFLTDNFTTQIANAIATGINAGLVICAIMLIISIALFCLYVAIGTWVVKKVWFSDWGGNPRRYR